MSYFFIVLSLSNICCHGSFILPKHWTIESVPRKFYFLWTISISLSNLILICPESLASWKRKFWMLQSLLVSSMIKPLQILLLPPSLQVSQKCMSENLVQRTLESLFRANSSVVWSRLIRLDVRHLSPSYSEYNETNFIVIIYLMGAL